MTPASAKAAAAMRWVLFAMLVVHGLIHAIGVAKGIASLPRVRTPISRAMAVVWLAAGVLFLAAAAMLLVTPTWWWATALVAAVASQVAIVPAWRDAKIGTVANVVVLAAAIHGAAADGPLGLHAEYRDAVAELAHASEDAVLTDADLVALPDPVRCFVRASGALGRPRARHVEARWRGRIRASEHDPWMEFTAEQHDDVREPSRFFFMHASRSGVPIDVLHVFRDASATMRVRALSLVPIVDASGPELTRAETVTLLNDLAVLAPGSLVDPAIRWESIDAHSARARYTVGANTIAATLHFDDACDLVDFVSDDRLVASSDGDEFTPTRWSTPLSQPRNFGPHRAAAHGEGRWHPDAGAFTYIELELLELRVE